jgi:AcrR family transcriptional regulator
VETVERTGSGTEQTRERLMAAALAEVGRQGYADVRVEDICLAAGAARATFYRHFSGKEGVLDALVAQMAADFDEASAEVAVVTGDRAGYEALRSLVTRLLVVASRWSPVIESLSVPRAVPEASRAEANRVLLRVSRVVGRALLAGRTPGSIAGTDPTSAAIALIALIDGFGHQVRTWDLGLEPDEMVDAVTATGLRMLHPDVDLAAVLAAS